MPTSGIESNFSEKTIHFSDCINAYTVSRCTTRLPGPENAYLFEDASLAFSQPSLLCKAAESFKMSRLPLGRFTCLSWKTPPGQWNTTRCNDLMWLTGHIRHVTAPPDSSCGIRLERFLSRRKPINSSTLPMLVCGRLFDGFESALFTADHLDCGPFPNSNPREVFNSEA